MFILLTLLLMEILFPPFPSSLSSLLSPLEVRPLPLSSSLHLISGPETRAPNEHAGDANVKHLTRGTRKGARGTRPRGGYAPERNFFLYKRYRQWATPSTLTVGIKRQDTTAKHNVHPTGRCHRLYLFTDHVSGQGKAIGRVRIHSSEFEPTDL